MFGKPAKLLARWRGDLPLKGQWLKAPRGRTAYEIVGIERRKPTAGSPYTLSITVLRHPPSEIPPGATVHEFHWDPRKRKTRRPS